MTRRNNLMIVGQCFYGHVCTRQFLVFFFNRLLIEIYDLNSLQNEEIC